MKLASTLRQIASFTTSTIPISELFFYSLIQTLSLKLGAEAGNEREISPCLQQCDNISSTFALIQCALYTNKTLEKSTLFRYKVTF